MEKRPGKEANYLVSLEKQSDNKYLVTFELDQSIHRLENIANGKSSATPNPWLNTVERDGVMEHSLYASQDLAESILKAAGNQKFRDTDTGRMVAMLNGKVKNVAVPDDKGQRQIISVLEMETLRPSTNHTAKHAIMKNQRINTAAAYMKANGMNAAEIMSTFGMRQKAQNVSLEREASIESGFSLT